MEITYDVSSFIELKIASNGIHSEMYLDLICIVAMGES